jgi:cell division transport system permease protein
MTDQHSSETEHYRRILPSKWYVRRTDNQASIVPEGSVSSTALVFVIAIMTFLACLTFGAVMAVQETAQSWQLQISREATVQIKPEEGLDMEGALLKVQEIAAASAGVQHAFIVDAQDTAKLLEPWLGSNFTIDDLPIPRLVTLIIDPLTPPDFSALKAAVKQAVPEAIVEDHRNWVDRLVSMAQTTVFIGIGLLILVLVATALAVIFATRGAMSGNDHIIEVLHFVGAESQFIAQQFRTRFFLTGIKGAVLGGVSAIITFFFLNHWFALNVTSPQGSQTSALFGTFSMHWSGYAGVGFIIFLIAFITAETTRLTVMRHLKGLDGNNLYAVQ